MITYSTKGTAKIRFQQPCEKCNCYIDVESDTTYSGRGFVMCKSCYESVNWVSELSIKNEEIAELQKEIDELMSLEELRKTRVTLKEIRNAWEEAMDLDAVTGSPAHLFFKKASATFAKFDKGDL